MANRFPLTINTTNSTIEELPAGDNLDLSGSNISNVNTINASGNITGSYILGNGSQLTGITTSPSGSNTLVQFNDDGSFGSSANLSFDKTTNTFSTTNLTVTDTSNLGDVGNVIITGGSNNQVIATDGLGNLSFIDAGGLSYTLLPVKSVAVTAQTLTGTKTIDGISWLVGDRVLLVGQGNLPENGIWIVQSGNWTRASDFTVGSDTFIGGVLVPVLEGTNYGKTLWQCTNTGPIGINQNITFVRQGITGLISFGTLTANIPTSAGTQSIAIGDGAKASGTYSIGIGLTANAHDGFCTAIGQNARALVTGATAIGPSALAQQDRAVAIGEASALNSYAIAIGFGARAGSLQALAIGSGANAGGQGIAIGTDAGRTGPGTACIAVGNRAAYTNQRPYGIAIGSNAGNNTQGEYAIAIGANAGYTTQPNNSIILNATGSNLNQTIANTFTVKPVRNAVTSNAMYYNATSGEITYGSTSKEYLFSFLNQQANITTANSAIVFNNVGGNTANITYDTTTGNLTIPGGKLLNISLSGMSYLIGTSSSPQTIQLNWLYSANNLPVTSGVITQLNVTDISGGGGAASYSGGSSLSLVVNLASTANIKLAVNTAPGPIVRMITGQLVVTEI